MKYAIIRINKKQHMVNEGDEILADLIDEKEIKPEVLLYANEGKVEVGKPILESITVKIKKLEDLKGEKVYAATYKSKSRSRRKVGFRARLSRLKIEKIG